MRKIILNICLLLGIVRLFIFLNRHNILILAMHQVMDEDDSQPYHPLRECMTSLQLKNHVDTFSKYYNFIPLDDAVSMLKGDIPLKPYSMVLTFDDGYRNNITHAYPILAERDIPFTIYLTSGLIENRTPMWVDRLDYAVLHYSGEPISCYLGDQKLELEGGGLANKFQSFQKFRRTAKRIDCVDFDFLKMMDDTSTILEDHSGKKLSNIWEQDDWSALLTWTEIDSEDRPLVTYGGHTNYHLRLARVPLEVAENELVSSKALIEERISKDCLHFAYPDGSFNSEVSQLLECCGYHSATTGVEGFNSIGADVFQLKRISVPHISDGLDMLARTSGLLSVLSRLKEMVRNN